jgi:small subunit ribosomal protein S20
VANTKSAEKQNRQSLKHRARNSRVTSTVRTEIRKARELLEGGDPAKTAAQLRAVAKAVSKAASKGIIHRAQASRRIGRLARAAHKAAKAQKPAAQ